MLGAALVAAVLIALAWVGRAGGPHVAVRTLPPFAHARRARAGRGRAAPARGRAQRARGVPGDRRGRRLRAAAGLDRRPARAARQLRARPARARAARARRGELVREDPFGLARRVDATRGSTALTVIAPPLELPEIALGGRGDVALGRQRLRSGGHELHGVREHQPGESLRGVHWPATAHRGRLMVKELDDPGGDELAVVLDARASADVGAARTRASSSRWPRPARSSRRRMPTHDACGSSWRAPTARPRARASAQQCGGCSRARDPPESDARPICSLASTQSASRSSRAGRPISSAR